MGNRKTVSFPLLKIGYTARKNLTPDEAKKLAPKNKILGDQFYRGEYRDSRESSFYDEITTQKFKNRDKRNCAFQKRLSNALVYTLAFLPGQIRACLEIFLSSFPRGGEGGIRTHGTGLAAQSLSRRPP